MQMYLVTLTAKTPLLMHRDNIEYQALVRRWQLDPKNNGKSVPGDDRTPAWLWIGGLYTDGRSVALPTDCLMAACMGAGAKMKTGQGQKTYKSQTQSGMAFTEPFMSFTNRQRAIEMAPIEALQAETDFDRHVLGARDLGFALDVRPVRIGTNGRHIRVRPVFDQWRAEGTLSVWDSALTKDVLTQLFQIAGDSQGLCEWKPSSKRPGPFGRFAATVTAVN